MEKDERGVEAYKHYNVTPASGDASASSVHHSYSPFNMSADMNSMFNSAFANVSAPHNDHAHAAHASLMNGGEQFSESHAITAQADTAQSSPRAASANNSSRYSADAHSPLENIVGGKNDIIKTNPAVSRENEQLSPSTASTVSPSKNDATINSPASSMDHVTSSPSAVSPHAEQSSLFPRDVNQTPQLPPYSGGYFHNILASYHGYRSFPPQNSDLDQAMATNIANIAKSVVQGGNGGQESKRARDKPFQCSMCHKRYTNRAGLTVHVLSHTGDTCHPCSVCSKRFTQKSALEQHMLSHSNQRPFECKVCYKTFTQKNNLNAHMMIHNGEEPYQCRICEKRFTQRSQLSAHISTHSEAEKMQAAMALGVGNPALALPYPVGPTHSNEMFQKYNPSMVGSSFPPRDGSSEKLGINNGESHMDTDKSRMGEAKDMRSDHHGNSLFNKSTEYPQPGTSTLLTSQPPMNSNLPGNHGNPISSYQNDTFHNILANIRNSFVGNVRPHTPKANDNKERPFQCMFCDKRFTQRAGLNAHVLIHSGTRPFPCTICDKRFTQKSGLDQHFLTHTGERPHQCPLCHKRFTQKANLNHHILTHTGEKRHICPFCERRFTQKANLNAHVLTHTGQKPHQCMVCDRKFTQKSGLNQHILTHTGEKPYQCKLCDKAYTQKSGLDVHMYSHSGEKPYRCQYCDKQFVARTLWVKHLRANHDHEEPPATNAYGRGGHGGMNLIPPAGLPGFKPTFDMLKSASDLFKQPPSDCFKLLHESYSSLNKSTNEMRPELNPSNSYKADMTAATEGRVGEFDNRPSGDLKSPGYKNQSEGFKPLSDSYQQSTKYASHFKESLSSDSKSVGQNKSNPQLSDKAGTRSLEKESCSFDEFAEKSSRAAAAAAYQFSNLPAAAKSSSTEPGADSATIQNGTYGESSSSSSSNAVKRPGPCEPALERYDHERLGQGHTGYKAKTSYVPGHVAASEAAHSYVDSRLGNLYQERYMNMYRDMMSNTYLPDAPPAFI